MILSSWNGHFIFPVILPKDGDGEILVAGICASVQGKYRLRDMLPNPKYKIHDYRR
jgi:hypothetical protein